MWTLLLSWITNTINRKYDGRIPGIKWKEQLFDERCFLDGDGDYNNDYLYDGEYYETYSLPGYLVNGVSTVPYLHLREVIDDYAWCCGDYDYGYFLEGADELSWNDGVATFTDSKGHWNLTAFHSTPKTEMHIWNGEKVLDLPAIRHISILL